jgi:nucleotide-binding universal stress UspA family protein
LALTLARRADASLELIHVHAPLDIVYLEGMAYTDESLNDHLIKEHKAYLKSVADRIAKVADVPVKTVMLEGMVSDHIAAYAGKHNIDLVVMTTHGRGPLGRFWLGSVADELIRQLPMPLLLVHPSDEEPYLEKQPEIKHLLLALDGTPLAEKMLEPTMELAGLMGAEVTLLRAIQPVSPMTYYPHGLTIDQAATSLLERVEVMQNQMRKEAQDYLDKIVEKFRPRGLKLYTRIVTDEQPAAAILREAEKTRAGLIAITTHARGGLSRLVLGSIADKVIRGAHAPVLVYHPQTA